MLKNQIANLKKENCIRIGTFTKVHGIKGEIVLRLDFEFAEIIKMGSILVEIDGLLVPFFITGNIKVLNNNSISFMIDDIDPEDLNKSLINSNVFLPLKDISTKKQDFQLEEFIGFSVIDENVGLLGTLNNIDKIPLNPLIQIISNTHEILLPINSIQLLKINAEKKILSIVAPKSLINFYLNSEM